MRFVVVQSQTGCEDGSPCAGMGTGAPVRAFQVPLAHPALLGAVTHRFAVPEQAEGASLSLPVLS